MKTIMSNGRRSNKLYCTDNFKRKKIKLFINTGSSNAGYQKMDSKSIPIGEISQGQYYWVLHKLDNGDTSSV